MTVFRVPGTRKRSFRCQFPPKWLTSLELFYFEREVRQITSGSMPELMFGNVGRTLLLLRELHGLNQAQFARRAGVGKSQLSKYEKGKDLPKLAVLGRMLGTLGISLRDFADILAFLDTLGPQQDPIAPNFMPSSASALLGPSAQEAFRKLLEDILALQREVLTRFLQNAYDRTNLGKTKGSTHSGQQAEGDTE